MPAKAVVEAAAKHGFKIDEHRVYNVRSAAKARAKTKGAARTIVRASTTIPCSDLTAADGALIQAALDVGLQRARELIARLERALGRAA